MASMKKEEARLAIVSEYDRWAKKHPNDAIMMGGFLFFRYLQNERTETSVLAADADSNGRAELKMTFTRRIVYPNGREYIEGVTPKQLPAPASPMLPSDSDNPDVSVDIDRESNT